MAATSDDEEEDEADALMAREVAIDVSGAATVARATDVSDRMKPAIEIDCYVTRHGEGVC